MTASAKNTPINVQKSPARTTNSPSRRAVRGKMVRKRSQTQFLGYPLWEVARGPDPAKDERMGHARAIFAVGDVADGLVAIGGISRGVISIGGISLGVFSLGGVSVGLAAALGGVAVGPLALGGIAAGAYALGGAGFDIHGRLHAHSQGILGRLAAYFPGLLRRHDR
jgi:hypothetical protein